MRDARKCDIYGSNQCKKTSKFTTQCKGDISHAFKTGKMSINC